MGISRTPDHAGPSLIRNPDAHFRVVTIEDFLDLTVEARRIDQWIDAAA